VCIKNGNELKAGFAEVSTPTSKELGLKLKRFENTFEGKSFENKKRVTASVSSRRERSFRRLQGG